MALQQNFLCDGLYKTNFGLSGHKLASNILDSYDLPIVSTHITA